MTSRRYRSALLILLLLLGSKSLYAQKAMPTFGKNFTFAIPEGPDNLPDPNNTDKSVLQLYVISSSAGTGHINSPSGYSLDFGFCKDTVTTIILPYSLMHLHDVGKTDKGILVSTSVDVELVLHDVFYSAGEVTQIYPDEALDTSYAIGTWSIYNDYIWQTDIFEDNHTQFVITAPYDNTVVTINPKVQPIGIPGAFPQSITLNRGQAYMIKADSTSLPVVPSLSGSMVTATKPISIISSTSCAYVPALPAQACNELLNMELPKKYADTIFYTCGFSEAPQYSLLFVSDVPNYFVIASNGVTFQSRNGVAIIPQLNQPLQCITTAPARCYQLSVGTTNSGNFGLSDPSMFNVLSPSQYIDSLEWYAVDNLGLAQYLVQYVSAIYPITAESQITIDGAPITSKATPQIIFGTSYASINIAVKPGLHKLLSPVPIYAFASGFSGADAYSYNIPALLPPSLPTIDGSVLSSVAIDSAEVPTCSEFDVVVRLDFKAGEQLTTIHSELAYDKQLLQFIGLRGGPGLKGNSFISDISTAGLIKLDFSGNPLQYSNDTICIIHFRTKSVGAKSTFDLTSILKGNGADCSVNQSTAAINRSLTIEEIRDTTYAQFRLTVDSAYAGGIATARFERIDNNRDSITTITLFLDYNHDLLELIDPPGEISVDNTTGKISLSFDPPLTDSGLVTKLKFRTYVSSVQTTLITASTDIQARSDCPLQILAPSSSALFTLRDSCSTPTLREFLASSKISIKSIVPNPAENRVTIEFEDPMPNTMAAATLTNALGLQVLSWDVQLQNGQKAITSPELSTLNTGTYFLQIAVFGRKMTATLLIRN